MNPEGTYEDRDSRFEDADLFPDDHGAIVVWLQTADQAGDCNCTGADGKYGRTVTNGAHIRKRLQCQGRRPGDTLCAQRRLVASAAYGSAVYQGSGRLHLEKSDAPWLRIC